MSEANDSVKVKSSSLPELVPVRMVNEYIYCPRLFYLEWVQCEWADNYFTEDGRSVHKRADSPAGKIPNPSEAIPEFTARSVEISAPVLGISGRIDVVESADNELIPIEYKRGEPPDIPEGAYEPDRVQLALYGLALRENGHYVKRGYLYFAKTRQRVEIPIDATIESRAREAIQELRKCAEKGQLPPPLKHSPKCGGCSLNAICLPDEIQALSGDKSGIRLLYPARCDALPLVLQEQGSRLGVSDEVLQVRNTDRELICEARLNEVSQVCLMGNITVSTQAMRALCSAEVPLSLFSFGGWYYGRLEGTTGHKNIELRRAQFRAADDAEWCLKIAKRLVSAKIQNCRTLVRRNCEDAPRSTLDAMEELRAKASEANSLQSLLGIEGNAARHYFSAFSAMLKPTETEAGEFRLDFEGRNRRPPTDPVNALLSYAYALLVKDWTIAVSQVGFDPYLGFYHQLRYGRPALALDLMEEFRPLIADSVVLQAVNSAVVRSSDFVRGGLGVSISPAARKRFIQAYERRMDQLVTHPVFEYRISYRRVLEVQARLLGRYLIGEIPMYPEFTTR